MVSDDWLALTEETPLEPELPIIDPHHHFWERPSWRYVLDELVADTAGHNIRQTVFIECSSAYREDGPEELRVVGETDFVEAIANESATGKHGELRAAAAIVGSADLRLGDAVAPVLEAHQAASARFRGIRHRAAWADPAALQRPSAEPPHLLLDSKFREGYARLADYDMTFEGWVYHPQIAELTDLAQAFPETTIVFNHLGGPLGLGPYAGRHNDVFNEWRRTVTKLADCPNVVAKVGGIQMPVNGFGWEDRARPPTSDELLEVNRRWYEHTIEVFGPERCMFESNFPVDRASCSYTVLWNQFKKLSAGFSFDERAAMFHDTAQRVYRMDRY
ncbi:MAG: amidohydrolase family protein [Dehalococcoidia bacterium]|jgi:L-fuconolactonase|nr:amidohydrolase family protein [Dehalococcoidia bacterium]